MVGAIGFEPTTPCAQGRCATRLRGKRVYRLFSTRCSCGPTRASYKAGGLSTSVKISLGQASANKLRLVRMARLPSKTSQLHCRWHPQTMQVRAVDIPHPTDTLAAPFLNCCKHTSRTSDFLLPLL